jgi:DNA-binding CsgD family transcriptional regulator
VVMSDFASDVVLSHAGTTRDVFRFSNDIRDCATLEACATLFRKTISQYGFNCFASGEVDTVHRNRSMFYIVDWPQRMVDYYVLSGYVERDPLLDEIKRIMRPFSWSNLRRDGFVSKAGKNMLDRVAAEGWTEGLAVPFPRSETRFGLVSMVGGRGTLSENEQDELSLMALCLHEQARRIGPTLGVALSLSSLSLRELDSLRLVARGHSDKKIAGVLGIAQSTAHEHVEAAKRKLKVKSRSEAAAIGVSLGLA